MRNTHHWFGATFRNLVQIFDSTVPALDQHPGVMRQMLGSDMRRAWRIRQPGSTPLA
jgi:hypothetical protein